MVVGAGLSIGARFPSASGLTELLWSAIDSDSATRKTLAQRLGGGVSEPAKSLVGDDVAKLTAAWEAVADSAKARETFQLEFARIDHERSSLPSPAHEALAVLIHAGIVEAVISFNWDTALEHAYQRLYGVSLPSGLLHKPHGDAAHTDESWILPGHPGQVTDAVSAAVSLLSEQHARTLMIVGYSERDEAVVDSLIRPLDERWRTFRIGPNASGPEGVQGTAEAVLGELAEPILQEQDEAAWQTITYAGSRGVDALLRGERLGPRDVDACPTLAEVDTLVSALRSQYTVILNGPTGSGKSITAYQALSRLRAFGYETLILRDARRSEPPRRWLADLRLFPRRKAILIDDAQDLNADTVRMLAERSGPEALVLVVGIDHVAGGLSTFRVNSVPAVATLSRWVRENRSELFEHLRKLDPAVGDFARDISFDNRIAYADRASTAWEFFYRLSGGWRRIRNTLLELREYDRSDFALLLVAAAQISSVDAGTTVPELEVLASLIGRDSEWLSRQLAMLEDRRLVLRNGSIYRCLHLMTAYTVLEVLLHPPNWSSPPLPPPPRVDAIASASVNQPSAPQAPSSTSPARDESLTTQQQRDDRETARAILVHLLESPKTSLQGLSWLSGRPAPFAVRDGLRAAGLLGPERDLQLVRRALSAKAGKDDLASAAALIADACSGRDPVVIDLLKADIHSLQPWFEAISPENGWAFAELVNALYNADHDLARDVANLASPRRVASLITEGGWPHSVSSGRAVERLCQAGDRSFTMAVATELDHSAYRTMLRESSTEYWRSVNLIADLLYVDWPFALELLTENAGALGAKFGLSPLRSWNESSELIIRMGLGPSFLRPLRGARRDATRAAGRLFDAIDDDALVGVLTGPIDSWGQLNFDEFVALLAELVPAKAQRVFQRVNVLRIEEALEDTPQSRWGSALFVLLYLREVQPDAVESLMERMQDRLSELSPLWVLVSPTTAVTVLKRGLPLRLGVEHQNWHIAAAVIHRLIEVDPDIAAEVVVANFDALVAGLSARASDFGDGIGSWMSVCDQLRPGLLDEAIGQLPAGAVQRWGEALKRPPRGRPSRREEVAPLVLRAEQIEGAPGEEARLLMRRFPSLVRQRSAAV